jgi:putative DNA primase/helicase
MRLAGSFNRKEEPYFVTVTSQHSGIYTLEEFIKAFSFDSFGSANSECFQNNNAEVPICRADGIEQNIRNISLGNDLHKSLISLAGYFAKDGMSDKSIALYLQSQMKISSATKDSRYHERYNEIPGIANYVSVNHHCTAANEYWPEPRPLLSELKSVQPLDVAILPKVMQNLVIDSSERMQCPPDFLAAGLIISSSSVIARNIVIQPKLEDTGWIEHPNLWGVIIGKPSLLKSPTLSIAMSALEKLEQKSRELHINQVKEFNVDCELAELSEKANKNKASALIKDGNRAEAKAILMADKVDDEDEPTQSRYVINDGTIEKIADLLCSNTHGLLVFRDELSGWFNNLNKPDKTNDRSFLLESWNGNKSYTVDRIGRGTTHIPINRLSILGGIQPDMYSKIVDASSSGSQGGDGLLQRFQIAVYPNVVNKVTFVDRAPNKEAIKQFEDKLLSLVNWSDEADNQLVLKFNEPAYQLYKQWFTENELLFRDSLLSPSLESHYAKYRGLVPSIACIFHVLNNDDFESNFEVDEITLKSAISYVEYLRSHAERIYALPEQFVLKAAKNLLAKFDKLDSQFTLRDVKRKKWSGLVDGDVVEAALAVLEEHGYCQQLETNNMTGRPSIYFVKHPDYQLPKLTKHQQNSSTSIIKERSL